MYSASVNEQLRLATLERIASYTVGIAVEKNRGIGTGTLVTDETDCYILTAAHVIPGADTGAARFFINGTQLIEIARHQPCYYAAECTNFSRHWTLNGPFWVIKFAVKLWLWIGVLPIIEA